jgi:pyridoxal phosphate enzyme (YggS family)
MNNPTDKIAENYRRISSQIAEAATRCGRSPADITIVGVSKYVDAAATGALLDAGCRDLGESRPQSLWDKAAALSGRDCRWHMIGHLQRNKVRRLLPLVTLIHSIDSTRLAGAVADAATEQGITVEGLIEVNISGDEAKHGFTLDQLEPAIEQLAEMKGLRITGLMAMAGLDSTPDAARRQFALLRTTRDRIRHTGLPSTVRLDHLSMGMSGDFPQAIEEGASIVRIGSSLFEGIDPRQTPNA